MTQGERLQMTPSKRDGVEEAGTHSRILPHVEKWGAKS